MTEVRFTAARIAEALGQPAPTPEQVQIIQAPARPLLVIAGAGSGKTETMASRVVWLVANGLVEPEQVLGLTFTRKAAGELAERVSRRLRRLGAAGIWAPQPDADGTPGLGELPTVQTYHSYAGRIVAEHGLRLGIEPGSRLLSEAAAWQLAAQVVASYGGPMDQVDKAESTVIRAVVHLAGEMAEHLLAPPEVSDYLGEVIAALEALPPAGRRKKLTGNSAAMLAALRARRQVLGIVEQYLTAKRERGALDFSDQMAIAAELATGYPAIGDAERARFTAVLLDEFQDTSEAQLAMLRALFVGDGEPGDHPVPVTAVGDPHQSIYGWRGASATTLSRFPELFRDERGAAQVLPLTTSWRNDVAVLQAANRTAAPLRGGTVATQVLHARQGAGPGEVSAARLATSEQEAEYVADFIAAAWFDEQHRHTGVTAAVLCRKRALFGPVMDRLEQRGIPVEAVGVGGLLATPEVADLVSLLSVVQDPGRGDRLMRLLTGPAVRLGPADLDGLAAWSRQLLRDDRLAAARRDGPPAAPAEAGPDAPQGEAADGDRQAEPPQGEAARDLEPGIQDEPSLVEALDRLPRPGWVGARGERLSDAARGRLGELARTVARLRSLTGLPLAELAAEAERGLGLDIEVLARPGRTPATARVHLDAFADVAAQFGASSDRPTLGGFLAWLDAADEEERGLDRPTLESDTAAVQILTVHAAKGLEWDVVAVPGLVEGVFPAHQGKASWHQDLGGWKIGRSGEPDLPETFEVTDAGWSGGLQGVPYDLRRDRDGLPELAWGQVADVAQCEEELSRFRADSGQHGIREERRLAYVAFTRARSRLLLTAPVWMNGKSPRITSRFLTELVDARLARTGRWEAMPPPDQANPMEAEPVTARWPVDPATRRRAALVDGGRRVLAAMHGGEPDGIPDEWEQVVKLLLAERRELGEWERRPVTLPRHLSASSVVALAGDPQEFASRLRRPMPSPPAYAARRGTRFHAWVEQHYAKAALMDLVELPGSADADADLDEDLEAMKQRFLAGEWASREPVEIELSVETWIGGLSVRGRIDAVFARPEGGFTIVDWKTGRPPTGTAAANRAIQLAAYRLAYARLRGVPLGDVDGAFYYAATGRTVRPQLAGEQDLERLLGAAGEA